MHNFNIHWQPHPHPNQKTTTPNLQIIITHGEIFETFDLYLWLLHHIPHRSRWRSLEFERMIYWQHILKSNTEQCQGSGQGRRRSQMCWCPHWCRAQHYPVCGWSGGHFPGPPGSRPPVDCHLVAAVGPCQSVAQDFLFKQEMFQKHICPPWCKIQVYQSSL